MKYTTLSTCFLYGQKQFQKHHTEFYEFPSLPEEQRPVKKEKTTAANRLRWTDSPPLKTPRRSVNDPNEWIDYVPTEPGDVTESAKSPIYGVAKGFMAETDAQTLKHQFFERGLMWEPQPIPKTHPWQ